MLELAWDCGEGIATVCVDGESAGALALMREADGVCYLRVKSTSEVLDGGCEIAGVEAVVFRD